MVGMGRGEDRDGRRRERSLQVDSRPRRSIWGAMSRPRGRRSGPSTRRSGSPTLRRVRTLRDALTFESLAGLMDTKILARGRQYLDDGRVGPLLGGTTVVEAVVRGTAPYQVRLAAGPRELRFACDCPMGEDGVACKHVAAVGLAWLADQTDAQGAQPDRATNRKRTPDVEAWIRTQPTDALVKLVLDAADNDRRFRDRLTVAAVADTALGRGGNGPDVGSLKTLITRATATNGFVQYRSARAFVDRIGDAVDLVEQLLVDGHPAVVLELCEHALARCERAIERMDDSDGGMGAVLGRLQDLHLEAVRHLRPDPVGLAQRLFRWEFTDEWGVFQRAAETYADVLGTLGLAEYRRLAQPEWANYRPLAPGDSRSWAGRRFAVESMMEAIARATGDVDALIAVKAADRSSAFAYLQIAEACLAAGRPEDAIRWAEQGIADFPAADDSRLHDFLADRHAAAGRHADAAELAWTAFAARPSAERFKVLRRHAVAAGSWAEVQVRALAAVREPLLAAREAARRAAESQAVTRRHLHALPDRSRPAVRPMTGTLLVELLLLDGDAEAAWQAARDFGCSDDRWLSLAKGRETSDPDGAVAVYRREIARLLAMGRPTLYPDAAALVHRAGTVLADAGRPQDADALRADVRFENRAKRKFIELLDAGSTPPRVRRTS